MGCTAEEHDTTLKIVFEKAKSLGIVFNKDKFQYKKQEVRYVGQIFSEKGMSIDKSRVESLVKLQSPTSKEQLKSMIGSFSYIRRYVPDMAELMSPLCKLLRKDCEFTWLPVHEEAFQKLKNRASSTPALTPFDPKKKSILQCDASKNGLGCCLFQNDDKNIPRLIACVSRTMNNTELNYGQTEKELLAIYFGVQKFHKFIYGHAVDVQTDHKPIVSIMSKHVSKLGSPRLKRLRLKLLMYNLNVYYVPGRLVHFADMLSRNSLNVTEYDSEMLNMVHSVSRYLPLSPEKKISLRQATSNDPVLTKIINYYYHGWPKTVTKDCQRFEKLKDSIYIQDGLLFFEDKIIVPNSLQYNIMKMMHQGHNGISKCINKAKVLFYWPDMRIDLFNFIKQCRTCEKYSPQNSNEPLLPHKIPKERYLKVGCDILEFQGKYFLIIVDYFSHWLELLPLSDKSSKSIINALQNTFTRFGYPLELVADNNPFSSHECQCYFKSKDIQLITSTPHYPKSNGMAEKAVHICKQILRKCTEDKTDFREGLMMYNNMPLSGLSVTPSQILNSRNVRTTVPCTMQYLKPKIHNVYEQLLLKQSICKESYNKRAKRIVSFKLGDHVVYREGGKWQKAIIVKKCKEPRSYLIRTEKGSILRRNSSQLKVSYTKNENQSFMSDTFIPLMYDSSKNVSKAPSSQQSDCAPINEPSQTFNSDTNVNSRNDNMSMSTPFKVSRSGRTIRPPIKFNL